MTDLDNPTGKSHSVADIAKFLEQEDNLLILSHYNPDPDAYGSSCALYLALKEMGKSVAIANQSGLVAGLAFIAGASNIVDDFANLSFSAVVICDCGDLKRLGDEFAAKLDRSKKIVNIDHHISNTFFGDLNLVDVDASSSSEIVFEVLDQMKHVTSSDVASALMAGLYGDTGSFRHLSTSARAFSIASALTNAGAKPAEIADQLFGNISPDAFRFRSHLMSNLAFHAEGQVVELIATDEDYHKFGTSSEDCEGMVEQALRIAGVKVSFFIRQSEDLWRISMRSRSPNYDISSVASKFGGGGHKVAAAFRSRKELDQIRTMLLEQLQELVIAEKG